MSTDLDLSRASDFTREAAAHLFTKRPEWAKMSSIVNENGEDFLRVRILAPQGNDLVCPWSSDQSNCFWIETAFEDITIGIEAYHQHFAPAPANEAIDQILTLVEDIISEAKLSFTQINMDGKVRVMGLGTRPDDQKPVTPSFPDIREIRIRSWTGRYDRTLMIRPDDSASAES